MRGVILLPTRDLAQQVFRVFQSFCRLLPSAPRLQCAVGAKALALEQQMLREVPDLLVCTPGRLAEHVLGRDACLDLSHLRWFVVDEADRLLTQPLRRPERWIETAEELPPLVGGHGPRQQHGHGAAAEVAPGRR